MSAALLMLVLQAPPETPVGMTGRLNDVVLPGPRLEPVPLENPAAPIVLRIARAERFGPGYRYDLVYLGLEPGTFDLGNFLRRADGEPGGELPPLPVAIRPAYPVGEMRPVSAIQRDALSPAAVYRAALVAAGVAWLAGMVALVALRRRRQAAAAAATAAPADRLRPLVERAARGELDVAEQAELERLLLGFWRRRAGLDGLSAAEALARLRDHAEAGPLLRALERWLHHPDGADPAQVGALLEPYRAP
jgi:hypothetical protein